MNDSRTPPTRTEGWTPLPTWLLRDAVDLTGPELLVLAALLSRANTTGQCWPSHATLAREARCSPSTAKRALGRLREHGLVSWEQRRDDRTGQSSNLYTTHVESPLRSRAPLGHGDLPPGAQGPTPQVPVTDELDPGNYTQGTRASSPFVPDLTTRAGGGR